MQTEAQEILERIKVSRGTTEPAPADNPENTEVVDVSKDAPAEEVNETEVTANEEVTTETEESESQEVTETQESNEGEDLFVEYKGREINLKDIDEWEQGHLRQADYTRKTQELSDNRKTFDTEREKFEAEKSSFIKNSAALEAMISEDTKTAEDLAEMREYEPEEFIKYQEKMTARKELLGKTKEVQPESNIDVEGERVKLWGANPTWLDNGKQTQAFTDDMTMIQGYAQAQGYSNEEIKGIQSAHHWQTLLDAARFQSLSKKNAVIEKKVRRAPVSTRPKTANIKSELVKAQEDFKANPNTENAVRLRKLKRQSQ